MQVPALGHESDAGAKLSALQTDALHEPAGGKGMSWWSTSSHRALQVPAGEGKGGFFSPSPAKFVNLAKPEGLSRCLIIKGV